MEPPRLSKHEVEGLRRSAACGGLPPPEIDRLLAEVAELQREREEIRELASRLVGPWSDVRQALNDLHRLLR